MNPATQNAGILRDLKRGRKVTALDALRRHGTLRLSARIFDLKKRGNVIKSRRICVGNDRYVAQYFIPRGAK